MAAIAHKTFDSPQRVRQFVVRQNLPSNASELERGEALAGGEAVAVLEPRAPASEANGSAGPGQTRSQGDRRSCELHAFLPHRSLRRRLDDAYESCYRSSVAEWFGDWFGVLFRK